MANVGKLMATLGLDSSDFDAAIGRVEGKIDGLGAKAVKGGAIIGGALGGAALAGIAGSIKLAGDFEHSIAQVGAVAGATGGELDKLADKALDIGQKTAFSAKDAAGAMETLAANGLTVEQILTGAADATVALAAAGGTDLATAADVASTAMKVFNLSGDEMADVVNRVAGAANVSRFDVEDMSGAIAQGAGIASAFGVSFADFSTVIASSADLFSSGSDAGTSFKTMLLRLANPLGEGKKAIAEYGLEFRDANGNLKDMGSIAGELNSKLGGLTAAQREQALAAIFGSDAMRTAVGLMRTGEEGFRSMSDTMGNTDAADIARQRMENFNGALNYLKGTIETVAIRIGMRFLPVLTDLIFAFADKLPPALAAAEAGIRALEPGFRKLIEIMGSAWQAIEPFVNSLMEKLGGLVDWFRGNESAMQAAGIIIGTILVLAFASLAVAAASAAISVLAALAPFLLIAAAVGVVVAAVVYLVQNWDALTARFPILAAAAGIVVAAFKAISDWVMSNLIPALMALLEAFRAAGTAIVNLVRDHWDAIEKVITVAMKGIAAIVSAAWIIISSAIEGALKVITGIINVFTGVLTGDWDRAWKGIQQILDGVMTALEGAIEGGFKLFKAIIETEIRLTLAILELVWDLIKGTVKAALDTIGGWITGAWQAITSGTREAWNGVWGLVSAAMGYIVSTVQQKGEEVLSFFRSLPGQLLAALGDLSSLLYGAGVSLIQGFLNGIRSMVGAVAGELGGLAGKAVSWKGPPSYDKVVLEGNGSLLMEGLLNGIASREGDLKALLGGYSNAMAAWLAPTRMSGPFGPGLLAVGAGNAYAGTQAEGGVTGRGEAEGWHIENSGPITINGMDKDEGMAELKDWSYRMGAAARGRGQE